MQRRTSWPPALKQETQIALESFVCGMHSAASASEGVSGTGVTRAQQLVGEHSTWHVRQRYAMAPVVQTDVHGEPASPLLRQVSMNAWKSVVPGGLVSDWTHAQERLRAAATHCTSPASAAAVSRTCASLAD